MKDKLLIIGASGHGKVCADIALKMDKWKSIAFLDDNDKINFSLGLDVISSTEEAPAYIDNCDIFVGIGDNATRKEIQDKLELLGASIPVLIHPSAVIGEQVQVEAGTAIMANVVINSSTKIGKGCIINTASTIDHDCVIEDFVHISPGVHLAGAVMVGKKTWLGIGSVVSNNLNITSLSIVGAGAVVIKDISEPGIYAGVPAKRIG